MVTGSTEEFRHLFRRVSRDGQVERRKRYEAVLVYGLCQGHSHAHVVGAKGHQRASSRRAAGDGMLWVKPYVCSRASSMHLGQRYAAQGRVRPQDRLWFSSRARRVEVLAQLAHTLNT